MNTILRFVMLAGIAVYFFLLTVLLKKERLLLKYTLLWLVAGIIMLVFTFFPGLLEKMSSFLGIYSPVNALFTVIIFCTIMILMSLTSIVSAQNEKLKRLIQNQAIIEERLKQIEKDIGEK